MSFEVNESVIQEVQKFFNKTPKDIEEIVQIVKSWMDTQHHLPETMEDVKIRNFLFLNKFSIEKTKQKIDMYYTIRNIMPELILNPQSKELQEISNALIWVPLAKFYKNLYRTFLLKTKQPNVLCLQTLAAHLYNVTEIRLYEDYTIGEVFVIDCINFTLNDVARFTPTLVVKCYKLYKEVFSGRLQKLFFINCPPYITPIASILRVALPSKIFSRIEFHNNQTVLNEFFSEDELPKDYGGKAPSLDELNERVKDKLLEYKDRFDFMDTMRTNEDLRCAKLENDEILGFHGNFRTLNVD